MSVKFEVTEQISIKDAQKILLENIQYSFCKSRDNIKRFNIKTNITQLTKFYNRNNKESLYETARKTRNYNQRFHEENIIDWGGSVWFTEGQSNSMQPFNVYDGETIFKDVPENSDFFAGITYEALFIDSYNTFERSIKEGSISDFMSAINKGISSIESSINEMADLYNHKADNKLIDNSHSKISFDRKIDEWIPTITGGKTLDKSTKTWDSFKKLKKFRDNKDQHFKGTYAFNYDEICELMNLYKYGVARMLFEIDVLFDRRISSAIIRAQYYPEITLIRY